MKLKSYLSLDGNSEAKLAATLGVSQSTVNRYANAKRWPDQKTIIQIKAATDGQVDFADWFDVEAAE